MVAKTPAERQQAWRDRNRAKSLIQVRVHVKDRAQAEKVKKYAAEMRGESDE